MSKKLTLDKYREPDLPEDDIDLDDLSYSKFSHVSGSSKDSSFLLRVQKLLDQSGSSTDSKQPPTDRQNDPPDSPRDSIDAKGAAALHTRVHLVPLRQTLLNQRLPSELPLSPYRSPTKGLMYPIKETLDDLIKADEPDENSPFIRPLVPPKIRSKNTLLLLPAVVLNVVLSLVLDLETTPKHRPRNPSVKVSLTPAQRMEKRPGIRLKNALENFQFEEMVGRGAFATVYKGRNLKTHQIVAIKQILLDKDQDVQGLMGEIDLLKILKHPNIVKYHGFVKTSNSLNVFLEFCAGGSLRQLYKKLNSGLTEPVIIRYVKQILNGLSYLHEQGVVHRDVKAANVLITETGDIKLADFGVATKVTSQHQSVVGTPNWMAPETVLGGEGLCTASDIWSLGATIIELFTTNPPYHDLNPMATLHAIGTDEYPPLPKNISSIARDFLLECFQKQPSLRSNAKRLLKHKWLNQTTTSKDRIPSRLVSTLNLQVKSITSYSENMEEEEDWDQDFDQINKEENSKNIFNPTTIQTKQEELVVITPLNKHEMLTKFTESNNNESLIDEDNNNDNNDNLNIIDKNNKFVIANTNLKNGEELFIEDEDDDPFLNIELDNFDTNELEIQSKMEFLITKFNNRVDFCQTGNDEIAKSLIKIMGKISHLVKKYPILHDVLLRDHGILSIFELLENVDELPNLPKLWYYSLSTLNSIFERNINQFENFCLLGGIPVVTQFRASKYDTHIKQQLNKFIRLFLKSDKALSMFISCGGLRVLSKLAEEDFEINPQLPITSIDCLHYILTNDFIINSKSDLCRKLSHYGVIFWFIVLLSRLVKDYRHPETIDKIVNILKFFGQSEVKVRTNISSGDLFKLLIKIYPSMNDNHKQMVLKFIKSMSCIVDNLKHLQQADVLEFLVILLKEHTPSSKDNHHHQYKEYINIICPILYNYCYLNHSRETELVRLGALPYLKELSKINLPFRQFILPLMCELVYCDKFVQHNLVKNNILEVYLNLLLDPYWQANALDSILGWYKSNSNPSSLKLTSSTASTCLISGFLLNRVSNTESALDNYLKLVQLNDKLCKMFVTEEIIDSIIKKLHLNLKNSVIQLTLLRILKRIMQFAPISFQGKLTSLHTLESRKTSLLVDELVLEIINIC